ncbi:hypothetical protein KSD_59900 [Ktedonobacter sp. SOSP1-85]|nr:hypothetical protein KSD_59900 [Ktedonobacter sp. SOSP1-85]
MPGVGIRFDGKLGNRRHIALRCSAIAMLETRYNENNETPSDDCQEEKHADDRDNETRS